MHNMKSLIIAMVFMMVIYLAGIISGGNAAVQMAAVLLSGLVLVWYALRVICCACKRVDKPNCSKHKSSESL